MFWWAAWRGRDYCIDTSGCSVVDTTLLLQHHFIIMTLTQLITIELLFIKLIKKNDFKKKKKDKQNKQQLNLLNKYFFCNYYLYYYRILWISHIVNDGYYYYYDYKYCLSAIIPPLCVLSFSIDSSIIFFTLVVVCVSSLIWLCYYDDACKTKHTTHTLTFTSSSGWRGGREKECVYV